MLYLMFHSAASTAAVALHHHQSSHLLPLRDPIAGASFSYTRAKTPKTTNKKGKVMVKGPHTNGDFIIILETSPTKDVNTSFELPTNPLPVTYDPAIDINPSGRPLFSFTNSFAPLTHEQANTYINFSLEEWNVLLPEGIPNRMKKDFKDTWCYAMMV